MLNLSTIFYTLREVQIGWSEPTRAKLFLCESAVHNVTFLGIISDGNEVEDYERKFDPLCRKACLKACARGTQARKVTTIV